MRITDLVLRVACAVGSRCADTKLDISLIAPSSSPTVFDNPIPRAACILSRGWKTNNHTSMGDSWCPTGGGSAEAIFFSENTRFILNETIIGIKQGDHWLILNDRPNRICWWIIDSSRSHCRNILLVGTPTRLASRWLIQIIRVEIIRLIIESVVSCVLES